MTEVKRKKKLQYVASKYLFLIIKFKKTEKKTF